MNPAGTDDTVLTVPDAALASGGVYSAFAIGTVYADSLDVLLVQDNAEHRLYRECLRQCLCQRLR